MKKDTPAFPSRHRGENRYDEHIFYTDKGMSLRDYFASKAMQALITSGLKTDNIEKYKTETIGIITAKWSYEYADAMLAEREK